tara:strand:- start:6634 stop:6822 length:189 start_codon:yes stop_codon:yes gene_type:complete
MIKIEIIKKRKGNDFCLIVLNLKLQAKTKNISKGSCNKNLKLGLISILNEIGIVRRRNNKIL